MSKTIFYQIILGWVKNQNGLNYGAYSIYLSWSKLEWMTKMMYVVFVFQHH